eukprot:m51a1_g805 hypothetical protein (723) ;mRNA; r:662292-665561
MSTRFATAAALRALTNEELLRATARDVTARLSSAAAAPSPSLPEPCASSSLLSPALRSTDSFVFSFDDSSPSPPGAEYLDARELAALLGSPRDADRSRALASLEHQHAADWTCSDGGLELVRALGDSAARGCPASMRLLHEAFAYAPVASLAAAARACAAAGAKVPERMLAEVAESWMFETQADVEALARACVAADPAGAWVARWLVAGAHRAPVAAAVAERQLADISCDAAVAMAASAEGRAAKTSAPEDLARMLVRGKIALGDVRDARALSGPGAQRVIAAEGTPETACAVAVALCRAGEKLSPELVAKVLAANANTALVSVCRECPAAMMACSDVEAVLRGASTMYAAEAITTAWAAHSRPALELSTSCCQLMGPADCVIEHVMPLVLARLEQSLDRGDAEAIASATADASLLLSGSAVAAALWGPRSLSSTCGLLRFAREALNNQRSVVLPEAETARLCLLRRLAWNLDALVCLEAQHALTDSLLTLLRRDSEDESRNFVIDGIGCMRSVVVARAFCPGGPSEWSVPSGIPTEPALVFTSLPPPPVYSPQRAARTTPGTREHVNVSAAGLEAVLKSHPPTGDLPCDPAVSCTVESIVAERSDAVATVDWLSLTVYLATNGDYVFNRAVCVVSDCVERLLYEEAPAVCGALRIRGLPAGSVAIAWLSQCFWGFLSFPDIVSVLALVLTHGWQMQVYICVAALSGMDAELLRAVGIPKMN